jgi:hypothetical protein
MHRQLPGLGLGWQRKGANSGAWKVFFSSITHCTLYGSPWRQGAI